MRSKVEITLFALFFLFCGMLAGTIITYWQMPGGQTVVKYVGRHPENVNTIATAGSSQASISIVAVSNQGIGVVGTGTVEIRPGQGRVLLNTNPFVEPDTQYSIETARKVAEDVTGKNLVKQDIIYSVEAGNAKLVGGPSAGAALCLATIAAIEHKKIRKDIAITGTIEPDGSIGRIGAVLEKAQAAGKSGKKLFMVPKGQNKAVIYKQKKTEKKGPGFVFERIYYEPEVIDLNKAMYEQYGMQVVEVSNIKEAEKLAFVH